jgi:DNA mismatch repair ATPase MutL
MLHKTSFGHKMSTIHTLSEETVESLRSAVQIPSFEECLLSLVRKCLTNCPTKITIKFYAPIGYINIHDNGRGIPTSELKEYCKEFKPFLCKVNLVSRLKNSFYASKLIDSPFINERVVGEPFGTTVIISELFYKIPVRKKQLERNYQYFSCKKLLFPIFLVNLNVNFVLMNLFTGQTDVIKEEKEVINMFCQLHELKLNEVRKTSKFKVEVLKYETINFIYEFYISLKFSSRKFSNIIFIDNVNLNNDDDGSLSRLIEKKLLGIYYGKRSRQVKHAKSTFSFIVFIHSNAVIQNTLYSSPIEGIKKDVIQNLIEIVKESGVKESGVKESGVMESGVMESGLIVSQLNGRVKMKRQLEQRDNVTKEDLFNCKVICQFDKKFILCYCTHYTHQTLFIIDQHSADERIKLERIWRESGLLDGNIVYKKVDPPIRIRNLSETEVDLFNHGEGFLRMWGFSFKSFDCLNSISIFMVPEFLQKNFLSPQLLKKELLDALQNPCNSQPSPSFCLNILKLSMNSIACRSAIKFGDHLTTEQSESLLNELKKTKYPFSCAHGRPSVVPLCKIII